ncbi:SipW-cognate class signal peptide [Halogranum gelatinilyticum]|uniref:SipW-cognate class signal peptide n=1 Tax=Halogranum gelatinilyticum TaxID=660521 RepID=A0A1G9UPJ7_9EURY|nr:SipW-dependent-type signal peptide-containing protein [Halogranum gelatinilyticum]SDM61786.1 SipW-cognate class signal peptide [Halogranum gelatinilyticum]
MSNDKSFRISRRSVLAGLGTIGVASAGAGLGTTAFFSDTESVEASIEAGRLDLLVDFRATYKTWLGEASTDLIVDGPVYPVPGDEMTYVVGQAPDWRDSEGNVLTGAAWAAATSAIDACQYENTTDIRSELDQDQYVDGTPDDDSDSFYTGYVDGDEGLMFSLNDVKPKDEGEATISLHLCDNPGYIGVTANVLENSENGIVEPEDSAGDVSSDDGELANYIYVRVWMDDDCSNTLNGEETALYQGSLAGLVEAVNESASSQTPVDGLQLMGAGNNGCFAPGVHCVAFDWYFICEPEDFDLPSDAIAQGTIGDELDAAGIPRDVNVAQTDRLSFELGFNAVQCRHNTPPAFRHVVGEGFGKNDAGADGLVEPVALEGKIRKGQSPQKGTFAYTLQNNVTNVSNPLNGTNVPNGTSQSFTLSYDGTTANLSVDDVDDTVDIDVASDITDAVGVTVRGRGTVSNAVVENLRLQVPSSGIDTTVPTLSAFDNASYPADNEPERYCAFLDVDGLDQGFTLTGDATLTWDANSSQEQPAVYFFAGATGA